jgi:hypothetical protein
MAKQIIKGLTMLMIVVALALVTAVGSAYGQSKQTVAKIPFEFVVGDKSLPAGEYGVAPFTSSGQVLRIGSTEDNQTALRLTSPITCASAPDNGKLVFHRYGSHYFLTEVWNAGETTGRQLVKSKQQRAIEREMAAISSKSESAQNSYEIVQVVAVRR